MRGLVLLAASLGCGVSTTVVVAQPRPASERFTPVVRVFKECSPAVVNLSTTTIVTLRDPFFFGHRFEELFDMPMPGRQRQVEQHSVGSGFLIHSDGFLVTNAHVIQRAGEVKVIFVDGTELIATPVAVDTEQDLAVLKVDTDKPLPFLRMGRSDDLMQGETVIAIGNPLGLQHTVTTGIVSALDRELRVRGNLAYKGLIQTDASINPGNSGGPLLNVSGELIGVNSAIRGDAQNIGFAIPADRLRERLPEMLDIQRLRRAKFGIHFGADTIGSTREGVRINKVDPDSPAAQAGLKGGDVVTAIEQVSTPDFLEAFSVLHRLKVGRTVTLNVSRADGSRWSTRVALTEIPKSDHIKRMAAFFGLTVREMNSEDVQRLGLRQPAGLLVIRVKPGTQAERAKIEGGDILMSFGGCAVTSIEVLGLLLEQVSTGDGIPMQFLRIQPDGTERGQVVLKAQ